MSPAPVWLLLGLAIPLGLFIALAGAVVFFASRYKKASASVIALGLVIFVGTLVSFWFLWPR